MAMVSRPVLVFLCAANLNPQLTLAQPSRTEQSRDTTNAIDSDTIAQFCCPLESCTFMIFCIQMEFWGGVVHLLTGPDSKRVELWNGASTCYRPRSQQAGSVKYSRRMSTRTDLFV